MRWMTSVRERTRARLVTARRGRSLPPFENDSALDDHVLQPLIMGRAVALHPLAVILAIATGVVTAGVVGGLVAVPLLAVGPRTHHPRVRRRAV